MQRDDLTLDAAAACLAEIVGFEDEMDMNARFEEMGIDSISVLEWFFTLDEDYELGLELEDDALFDEVARSTVPEVYNRLIVYRSVDK